MADDASADLLELVGGGGGGKVVKPAEEFINLQFDDSGDVPSYKRPEKGFDKGKGKGKGKGKDKGRPPEPKSRKHKVGEALKKYRRPGQDEKVTKVRGDEKLRGKVKRAQKHEREALHRLVKGEVLQTTESGYLEVDGELEDTRKVTQADIVRNASVGVAKKTFSFDLPSGPYNCAFTSNGQHLLVGGRKGHVAMLHCETMGMATELQLKETVRAVQPLHNHTMFAVAQKKYTYIYDNQGIEIHCLKENKYPTHMDFLRFHYLLVIAGEQADLRYRDVSTGQDVCMHKTRLGPIQSMRQNPKNAVMHLGHTNGTVTMWTPNVKTPVVKMFCHNGHVSGLAVHGWNMVTAGADGYWKVWDLRKYEGVHVWKNTGHPIVDIDVSATGLLAAAYGPHVDVWRGVFNAERPKRPYMTEMYAGNMVGSVRFRPYEDILGVGHSGGFANIIIPGAGMANFDSLADNPFETKKQRREKEVHSLLEKLQPDSIMLDVSRIGSIDKGKVKTYFEENAKRKEEEDKQAKKEKKKMRGGQKIGKRMKRKQLKQGKIQRDKTEARLQGEGEGSDDGDDDDDEPDDEDAAGSSSARGRGGPSALVEGSALRRFSGKRQRRT